MSSSGKDLGERKTGRVRETEINPKRNKQTFTETQRETRDREKEAEKQSNRKRVREAQIQSSMGPKL